MAHPNIPGGFKSEEARQKGTSAAQDKGASIKGRKPPVAKRVNGRMEAINRRLAMKKSGNKK